VDTTVSLATTLNFYEQGESNASNRLAWTLDFASCDRRDAVGVRVRNGICADNRCVLADILRPQHQPERSRSERLHHQPRLDRFSDLCRYGHSVREHLRVRRVPGDARVLQLPDYRERT